MKTNILRTLFAFILCLSGVSCVAPGTALMIGPNGISVVPAGGPVMRRMPPPPVVHYVATTPRPVMHRPMPPRPQYVSGGQNFGPNYDGGYSQGHDTGGNGYPQRFRPVGRDVFQTTVSTNPRASAAYHYDPNTGGAAPGPR